MTERPDESEHDEAENTAEDPVSDAGNDTGATADVDDAEHTPWEAGHSHGYDVAQAPPQYDRSRYAPPQYPMPPRPDTPTGGMPPHAASAPYPEMNPHPGMTPRPVPARSTISWPEPDSSSAPKALLAALIGGAGAALFLPLRSFGIGLLLLGSAMTVGLVVAARAKKTTLDKARVGWSALALLLLMVPMFRAAPWLSWLCLMTACVAGTFAVAAPRKPREFAMSAITIPSGAFRALPWAARGTRDARATGRNGLRLVLSVAVTLVLLLLFGALFSGADARFADLASSFLPRFDAESAFRWFVLLPVFALAALGAAFTMLNPPKVLEPHQQRRTLNRLEWALPVGVLAALFLVFVGTQVPALVTGEQQVRSPADLTYADYARSGFWQLTAVTILTLPIIGAAARWAPKNTTFDRALLRGLGGALAVLTLVIVGCSLVRMSAYQEAYGFTVMRLLVETCELWLGVVYLLILAAGIRLEARWLPGAALATAMVTLLGLSALNPEGRIASNNIARFQETGKLDAEYLGDLSSDVVPELGPLPDQQRESIRSSVRHNLIGQDFHWRAWNLSRTNAGNQLAP